jgi:DNA polymerase III subunit epsilon
MFEKITVFDVETPNHRNNRICSIGITQIENGEITSNENYLINPECTFDRKNIGIHGIRQGDVIDSPTFDKLWPEIENLFFDRIVVAHSAPFDLSVLKKTLNYYGISVGVVRYLDTYCLARGAYKCLDNYKLNTVSNHLNICLEHHNSGSDSLACAKIFLNLLCGGYVTENAICTYYLSGDDITDDESEDCCERKRSETSKCLDELIGILEQINSDGSITEAEVELVNKWVACHTNLKGNYPFDDVFSFLEKILEDNQTTSIELQQMCEFINKIIDPLGNKNTCDCGKPVEGKNICLSGEFKYGSRDKLTEFLSEKGAFIQKNITRKTDILVVGSLGSNEWVTNNYGTKVKKALELQKIGIPIEIVKEENFLVLES